MKLNLAYSLMTSDESPSTFTKDDKIHSDLSRKNISSPGRPLFVPRVKQEVNVDVFVIHNFDLKADLILKIRRCIAWI